MSARRAICITGTAASQLLKRTYESTGILPLKSVAGDALEIVDLVKNFRTSKKEWQDFGTYVQDIMATITDSLGIVDADQTEIIQKLETLRGVLNEITETIKSKQREGFWARSRHFLEHPDMIIELKKKVDDAVDLLKFDLAMKVEIKVDKTLKIAGDNSQKLSKVALDATRSKLRYVDGASWDPDRVCLEHTRKHVIDEILSWVDNATDSRAENILLLTGVAGAGKSTVAHTIAQHYHSRKQLVTSFFFDRETNERNNPRHLISTIAIDLCQTDEQMARRIMRSIEEDERVAHAPISRQFEELVLQPCRDFVPSHPLVIILDALDEGYDNHLLTILSQRATQLPHRICFIVTARTSPELEELRQQPHVHELELDIHAPKSIGDVELFVLYRLKKVAMRHRLGDHWPDPKLVASFAARTEGLFLWAATVCDYLLTRTNPANELQKLVSASHTSGQSAESKMDKLYTTILQACNWDDEAFVEEYQRLMGAAVASKTPLTLGALGSLYQHEPVVSHLVRQQLSPLLTGLGNEDTKRPVRVLHQSLRDFLTRRASGPSSLSDGRKFALDMKAHSQTLASLCLVQMNRNLKSNISCIAFLAEDDSVLPGIPSVSEDEILEELWYACRFWVDHLLDFDLALYPSALKQLEEFLGTRLIMWMELTAAFGQYEGLSKLQNWVKGLATEQPALMPLMFQEFQASASGSLAQRLDYMGRLEEALIAAKEGVEVYRTLVQDSPGRFQAGLSRGLHILSHQLRKLGYREDALAASEEALKLRRQLATEQNANANCIAEIASSVHSFSENLANLGRHEEALKSIEEAVELRRRLASEQPAAFTPDLASSINDLSGHLSNLGRHEEALNAIEEAMKLRRQLANEQPAAFTPDLAASVHELSVRLFDVGRHEESLEAIEEAVKLRRQLASERPAAFTPKMADSVHALSVYLSNLGRHEEALEASEEEVQLYRQLASERPAAFTSSFADSLYSLAVILYGFDRYKEALETTEEAVRLQRQLASDRPAAFTSDLAYSVHALSIYLYTLDRHEEALTAMEEAVKLRRQLSSERPAAFNSDLASSLYSLAISYKVSGFYQKALAAIKESVELYRPFAERYPAKHGTNYSRALQLLDEYHSEARAHIGALESPQPEAATPTV